LSLSRGDPAEQPQVVVSSADLFISKVEVLDDLGPEPPLRRLSVVRYEQPESIGKRLMVVIH
jgi:hypothetical protein